MDALLQVIGGLDVSGIILVLSALIFIYKCYDKVSKTIIQHYEEERKRNEQMKDMMQEIARYPQYRQQSIDIQHRWEDIIANVEKTIQEVSERQEQLLERINQLENKMFERELNKLRDRLVQSYKYYTNKDNNPRQAWTELEKEAFMKLFKDYEEMGGNGYMHSVVLPDMETLEVILMHEHAAIAELMKSRK